MDIEVFLNVFVILKYFWSFETFTLISSTK